MVSASRRLFFTHCDEPAIERGSWHADQVFGSGSAILLKYRATFFLLTAKHVITSNTRTPYQNASPFYSISKARRTWDLVQDMLFPARMWEIGNLIQTQRFSVDVTDVCLIELFRPLPLGAPDQYIDLDGKDLKRILPEREFNDGQILIASGFPHERNGFEYENVGEFTHSTNVRRSVRIGVCRVEDGQPTVDLKMTKGTHEHVYMNGMSGGIVTNVKEKANSVSWCGLILAGGGGLIRFCPAAILLPAILNYEKAPYHVIDPAFLLSAEAEERDFEEHQLTGVTGWSRR